MPKHSRRVVKRINSPISIMTKVVHRRSDTGKFTTEKYADKHPKTTEREVIRTPPPAPPSKPPGK